MRILLYGVMLVTFASIFTKAQCLRRYAIYTVRYGSCRPKRLLVRACMGGCFTHSRPSQTSPTEVMHFCQCCQQDGVLHQRTLLRCPARGNPRHFQAVPFPVSIAESCRCRPCSVLPENILPSEGEMFYRPVRAQ